MAYCHDELFNAPNGRVTIVRRQLDLWSGDGHLTPNGKDTLSDVTGVHGISARMQFDDYFPLRVDEALVTRAAQKCRKYQRGVEQLGCNFTPLVFETISGRVSPALEAFVASRNAIIADRTGLFTRSLLGRIGCC